MQPPQPHSDNIIDITNVTAQPTIFECVYCSVALLPYPRLKIDNPYAGEGFICPKCGTVIDSSYTSMRAQVRVEPVDVGDPSSDVLETIAEDRGKAYQTTDPADPEPNEDEWIKAQGGKILDKRVTIFRDY